MKSRISDIETTDLTDKDMIPRWIAVMSLRRQDGERVANETSIEDREQKMQTHVAGQDWSGTVDIEKIEDAIDTSMDESMDASVDGTVVIRVGDVNPMRKSIETLYVIQNLRKQWRARVCHNVQDSWQQSSSADQEDNDLLSRVSQVSKAQERTELRRSTIHCLEQQQDEIAPAKSRKEELTRVIFQSRHQIIVHSLMTIHSSEQIDGNSFESFKEQQSSATRMQYKCERDLDEDVKVKIQNKESTPPTQQLSVSNSNCLRATARTHENPVGPQRQGGVPFHVQYEEEGERHTPQEQSTRHVQYVGATRLFVQHRWVEARETRAKENIHPQSQLGEEGCEQLVSDSDDMKSMINSRRRAWPSAE